MTEIILAIEIILFLFVCELFIIFFCCLICVDFFFAILCFFFCYTLPCFLLVLGDWAYLVICLLFIVICSFVYLFIYLFFYLHRFSGFFLCKFNCSWYFFTSSDRVPPGGVAQRLRFEYGYRRVVSYTNDDLGKRVAWLTRFDGHGTEETVDDELGGRCLGAGRCPVAPPSGWSWLDDLGDGVNCFVCFFSFENPWRLLARCWNGEKFLAQRCALPRSEPLVDRRPRRKWLEEWGNVCGGEGGNVT